MRNYEQLAFEGLASYSSEVSATDAVKSVSSSTDGQPLGILWGSGRMPACSCTMCDECVGYVNPVLDPPEFDCGI